MSGEARGGGRGGAGEAAEAVLFGLVDEIGLDLCVGEHKAARTAAWVRHPAPAPVPCKPKARSDGDLFGNTRKAALSKTFKCHSCGRSVGATKYAQHLESCLNMSRGRSSRTRRQQQAPASSASSASSSSAGEDAFVYGEAAEAAVDDVDDDDSDFDPSEASGSKRKRAGGGTGRRGRPAKKGR